MKTPISAISPDCALGSGCGSVRQRVRGFTLIELLVVMAIAGLMLALVPVAYNKARESTQYTAALRTIIGEIRQARQKAVAQGAPAVFFVDLVQRQYGLAGVTSHALPEELQVKVTVGSNQMQPGQLASIEFLPEGGASGGSIEVIRPNGAGTRIRVDWLSGMVTQERLLQ